MKPSTHDSSSAVQRLPGRRLSVALACLLVVCGIAGVGLVTAALGQRGAFSPGSNPGGPTPTSGNQRAAADRTQPRDPTAVDAQTRLSADNPAPLYPVSDDLVHQDPAYRDPASPAPPYVSPTALYSADDFQRVRVPRVRTRYVPDPSNPGRYRAVTETVFEDSSMSFAESELSQQISRFVQELRGQATAEPSEESIAKLKRLVQRQFDARHRAQVERFEEVLKNVEQARKVLASRENQKDEIITRRVNYLLGRVDPLDWEYRPATPSGQELQRFPLAPPNVPGYYRATPAQLPDAAPASRSATPAADSPAQMGRASRVSPQTETPDYATTAPVAGRRNEPAMSPEPYSGSRTVELADGNSEANVPPADLLSVTRNAPGDLVTAGYRLLQLSEEWRRCEALSKKGALTFAEAYRARNAHESAKTQWEFMIRDLKLAGSHARAQVELVEQRHQLDQQEFNHAKSQAMSRSLQIQAEKDFLDTRQELLLAKSKLQKLEQELEWVEEFSKRLNRQPTEAAESGDDATGEALDADSLDEQASGSDDSESEPLDSAGDNVGDNAAPQPLIDITE